jgi:hypothetical protein
VAGVAVIGLKVIVWMAEDTVLGRTVVVLGEGVLGLGGQCLSLVAELAELIPPALVTLWIGFESLGRMAHQTVRPSLYCMQDGQRRHTGRVVAGAATRFVVALVGRERELGNLPLAVAAQAGPPPLHRMQDGRRRCWSVTELASVVSAPLVIGRDGLLPLHPVARPTVLTPNYWVGNSRGISHQCIG